MKIISASFFWRNDRPDGLGITFRPPGFTPDELTNLFAGDTVRQYFRDSDANLGTALVETYLAQLADIATKARQGPLPLSLALLAALNIMWLTERGFVANDDFNGPLLVYESEPS